MTSIHLRDGVYASNLSHSSLDLAKLATLHTQLSIHLLAVISPAFYLVVEKGLPDLFLRVHHKRSIPRNGLSERLPSQEQEAKFL